VNQVHLTFLAHFPVVLHTIVLYFLVFDFVWINIDRLSFSDDRFLAFQVISGKNGYDREKGIARFGELGSASLMLSESVMRWVEYRRESHKAGSG
jgi:hypothetical protein